MAKVRCDNCGKKIKLRAEFADTPSKAIDWKWKVVIICLLSAVVGAVLASIALPPNPQKQGLARGSSPVTLGKLLDTPPQELGKIDIATMNLVCAEGLPGSESLNMKECLDTLDAWAAQVTKAMEERRFVYDRDPAKFDNQINWWRVDFLVSYLNRIIGTHYSEAFRKLPLPTDKFDTTFFADSHYCFLHGLLTEKKEGTCSSMPVLVVSVGRRMGYPLKLVRTNRHLFVRWDDQKTGERFNVEVTPEYPKKNSDSFYMTWPDTISEAEAKRCGLLTSLNPAQELSVFLAFRGMCLWHAGRRAEAAMAFAMCHHFDPLNPRIAQYMTKILNEERNNGFANGCNNGPVPGP